MNRSETNALLTYIAGIDNRRLDDATVLAWYDILGDLPYDDCLQAARRHFGESEKYLMPVHIRQGADQLRRERIRAIREAQRTQQLAIESAQRQHTEDRSPEVTALVEQLRDHLGRDYDPNILRRREWACRPR